MAQFTDVQIKTEKLKQFVQTQLVTDEYNSNVDPSAPKYVRFYYSILFVFKIKEVLYGTGTRMIPETQITTANVLFYINCNGECQDIYESDTYKEIVSLLNYIIAWILLVFPEKSDP